MNGDHLALVGRSFNFPFVLMPPVAGVALDDRFLVAGRDESLRSVFLVSLDENGVFSRPQYLPLESAASMTCCGDHIHLVGSRGDEFHSLTLHQQELVTDVSLKVGQEIMSLPRTVCVDGAAFHIWVDGQGNLVVSQGDDQSAFPLADFTLDLTVVASPGGITMLRSFGIPGNFELLRWESGQLSQRRVIEGSEQGYSPLLYWLEEKYLIAWVSRADQSIRAQTFSPDLYPSQTARTLMTLEPPLSFRWLRGFVNTDNRVALAWQIEEPGMEFSDQGSPLPGLKQYVALFDPVELNLGLPGGIDYQSESYFLGGWVKDRLVVLRGGHPVVSIFAVDSEDS